MARRSAPRHLLAGLTALVLAVLPGAAAAAELPPDVVADGTITVVVTDPLAAGAPLDAMTVTLTASRPDLPGAPVIQELTGTTDAAATVVFSAVARPADGAPPVVLRLSAVGGGPNGCGGTDQFTGEATGSAAVDLTIELPITSGTSSCTGRTLAGRVVDAAGEPFPVALAEARITVDGVEDVTPVGIDPNGDFAILLDGDPGLPTTVLLGVFGVETVVVGPGPDCERKVMEVAEARWELAPGAPLPEPMTIVSQRIVLTEVCGTSGTPGPAITLPPTDRGVPGPGASSGAGVAGALMVIAGGSLLALAAALWRRRRPVTSD